MSTLNTALGKLHEILASWDDQNKAMDIVGWYNSYMCKELEASRKVVEAARDFLQTRNSALGDLLLIDLHKAIKELDGGE